MSVCNDLQSFRQILTNGPLLALDYGSKKIGVAVSSPSRSISLPLGIVENKGGKVDDYLKETILSQSIIGIVIGLPVRTDGSETEGSESVRGFANHLSSLLNLPILLQEERRTTLAANSLLKIAGFNRKTRNKSDDSIAACLILDAVLNGLLQSPVAP